MERQGCHLHNDEKQNENAFLSGFEPHYLLENHNLDSTKPNLMFMKTNYTRSVKRHGAPMCMIAGAGELQRSWWLGKNVRGLVDSARLEQLKRHRHLNQKSPIN